jgi:hypothetical protein
MCGKSQDVKKNIVIVCGLEISVGDVGVGNK